MACFLVPVAEAVAVSVAKKVIKTSHEEAEGKITFKSKLGWLNKLLLGGSALLCYEHVWHGEVVPFFPFLTAMNDPAETVVMLEEMASVGGTMAVWLTAIWIMMVLAAQKITSREPAVQAEMA